MGFVYDSRVSSATQLIYRCALGLSPRYSSLGVNRKARRAIARRSNGPDSLPSAERDA